MFIKYVEMSKLKMKAYTEFVTFSPEIISAKAQIGKQNQDFQ